MGCGRAERERMARRGRCRSEEHTSELQSRLHLVCRLLLEKKTKEATPASLAPPSPCHPGRRCLAYVSPLPATVIASPPQTPLTRAGFARPLAYPSDTPDAD